MAFGAQILADSLSPDGCRLTTFMFDFPRYIQAEVNTHRILSKNSASSRAIPVPKMIERLLDDPYTPVYWGSNKKGMQAGEELSKDVQQQCLQWWLKGMDDAIGTAAKLRDLGLHKQDANRLLEPWMWQTVIMTGTEWWNFFNLRNHPDAHPAFQTVAAIMQDLYETLEPTFLNYGDWHLPLWDPTVDGNNDMDWENRIKVSAGRCARVSLLTHEGKRDIQADIGMHDNLLSRGHMSPFEHQGRPAETADAETAMVKLADVRMLTGPSGTSMVVDPQNQWSGNFCGFVQYRKTIPHEADIMGAL